jgi:outer membrane receptor protein involved in Fe transport
MASGLLFAVLVSASTLTGAVQSPDGKPIAHATITVDRPAASTTSDAGGNFSLDVAALPVELNVSAPGFAPARVTVTASPAVVTLTPLAVTESVVVFGNAAPSWRDAATGVTTLSRDDLDRVPAMTPDESLRVVSGFSLFRRSSSRASNPTTHGVTMRGLSASGSSRALILVDGVPLNEGFGGWVTWERVPAAAIEQVSVQRGPASDVFGSDALGGVVRLGMNTGARRSGQISLESGSLDTSNVGASGGGTAGGAALYGAASWFDSEGFIPLEAASRGAADAAADTTWTNAYGRASFGRAERRVTLSGWGGSDDRGNGTVLQRNRSHGGTGTAAFEGVFGGTTLAARASGGSNWYEQTFSSIGAGRATEKLTSTQQIDTDMFRAIAELGHAIPRGQVTARASLSRTSSVFDTIAPAAGATAASTVSRDLRDDNQSLSAQGAFAPITALTLSAGVRHEWREAPVTDSTAKGATVARGSAAWAATEHVALRAAAATSHRWPTLNELARDFAAGSTTTKANADLLPERARAIEAGIDFSAHRQQLTVTVFRSVVHDAISNVTIPSQTGILRQRRNAGDAHSNGVEIDGEVRASVFRLRASMTFLNARFRNSQEAALEGNWLPQVPKRSIAATGDVLLPRQFVFSAVLHDVASQFDDDRNVFLLAGATQVDLRLASRWRALGWQIAVENVGDARIETGRTPLVALAQGRAVRAGLSIQLGR